MAQGGLTGNETQVTYPEFLKLPDGDLFFFYRQGGSGDVDLRLNRYDSPTQSWSVIRQPLIDGYVAGQDAESANAYWNTPTIDSAGNLHLSWSFRMDASSFQTNHDLYYAVSPDGGVTWQKTDGTPYAMPITQSNSDLVVSIPEGFSYINQTSMTVDMNDRPVVASRWAPEAGSGNDQAQQMLEWFDGTDWQVSQITDFAPGSSPGRRPAVLVDQDHRVLVLISGSSLGNMVLAHSMDRENWDFLALDDGPNSLEPTYDLERWQRDGVISMLYQRTGSEAQTLSLFEFDARSYFTPVPEPSTLALLGLSGLLAGGYRLARRRRAS